MLGFGGHFLTKGRRYSVTFGALRKVRVFYRRNETTGPQHGPIRTADHAEEETILIIEGLHYAGTGWKTTGDALLASTAADLARRRREAGREELAHEQGFSVNGHRRAA
jgi:Replication initiator protein, pSAM2